MTLNGRVALVTGGSGGIGRRICERLAAEGAAVAVHYAANAAPAEQLAGRLERAVALGADLRSPEATTQLVTDIEERLGPIDVLVANAGLGRKLTLEEVTLQDLDDTIAVNLRAPFLLAQRVAPGMRERGFGRMLFTSSVAAFIGGIVGPHYAASKSGLHGLTHYLSMHLAPHGVTVNTIAPALIEDTAMLPGDPGALAGSIPVRRLGRPEEVADLALAILHNPYMTNQVISLDGGIHPR